MKIIGVNFGSDELSVKLEGNELHVISSNSTEILVYLPAGITPGTYLLKVSIGNRNREDTFNVAVGAQGPRGEPGPQGAQGPRGGTGPRGHQGDIGPVGPRGPQGNAGPVGPQGLRGANGATGAQGPTGNTGPVGPQGSAGADGAAGAPGAKGMNFRDVYNSAVTYAVDDVVTHGGSSFIAKTANAGVEPTIGANWGLVAQQGHVGQAGSDGATGPAGPAGPRGPEGPPGPGVSSFDSLEGLTCRNGAGRTSIAYSAEGDATLRCILNAPPPGTLPSLIINDVTQPETQTLLFSVALSAPSFQTVTVQFATEDVSAVAGADYVGLTGVVTFLPGELAKMISVTSLGDSTAESDETFNVNLTSPVNANIGDAQAVGTIRNAVPSSSISISNSSCFENQPCLFTVTRTGDTFTTVTVDYETENGSADGSDFVPTTGRLTFLSGQTTLSILVHTIDDQIPAFVDENEIFAMRLFNPSALAVILDGQGIGTIRP